MLPIPQILSTPGHTPYPGTLLGQLTKFVTKNAVGFAGVPSVSSRTTLCNVLLLIVIPLNFF